jgi:acyl-CoA thioester hydrolase
MSRPDHAVTVSLEIPFHDCDPLFVAWHGRYFQYLEAGRQALLTSFRLDVPDLVEMGHRLYVTDVRCRYMFPLTYKDRVNVSAWLSEPGSSGPSGPTPGSLIKIAYDVFNETRARRAARAYTVLAFTDRDGTLLTEIPPEVRARLPD